MDIDLDVIAALAVILVVAIWAYAMLRLVIGAIRDAWRARRAPSRAVNRAWEPADSGPACGLPLDPFDDDWDINPTTGYPMTGPCFDIYGYAYGEDPE